MKHILMDFYLNLLYLSPDDPFRSKHQDLYSIVASTLADELGTDVEIVQNIFERMASED